MKNWIKTILREALEEMAPMPKPEFGNGIQHTVFSSKKYPDRLYKIGNRTTVKQWVDIFKENPKIFPKIYRVFPSSIDPRFWVVEIEKLDTMDAKDDFILASNVLSQFFRQNNKSLSLRRIDAFDRVSSAPFSSFIIQFKKYLMDVYGDDKIVTKLLRWIKTVYYMYNFLEKKYNYMDKDIHSGNVAYDKYGNIKIIDI